jgi:hypothetical protein
MYIALVGFVGYIICKALKRKSIGQMIVLLCIFTALTLIVEKAQPIINGYKESKQQIEQYKDILNGNPVEQKDDTKKIWDIINNMPNGGR